MKRVNKRYTAFVLLMLVVSAVAAQEFWMQPLKFIYSLGEKAKINFEPDRRTYRLEEKSN